MRLNEIKDFKSEKPSRKRVGRGIGSGTGKTSGKGHKGQNSRSGVSLVGFEGGQMPLYRRLPKRGFVNPFSKEFAELNIEKISEAIDKKIIKRDVLVTEELLIEKGIIKKKKDGVKLLANGEISVKLNIQVKRASKSAVKKIEASGGTVEIAPSKEKLTGKGKGRDKRSHAKKELITKYLEELSSS